MKQALPYMMHILEFFDNLEECEYANDEYNGRYFFAESVNGVSYDEWENFKKGEFRGGYGTSFESVIRHAIDTFDITESDIILIMTDGESSLSEEIIEEFNKTGMKAYTIYFLNKYYESFHTQTTNHSLFVSPISADPEKLNML